MKRFMITAAMAAMLMTTATAYGKVEKWKSVRLRSGHHQRGVKGRDSAYDPEI